MFLRQLPKFTYYQRLKTHMKINDNIKKENLDIQNTFRKLEQPIMNKLKQKVNDNKRRIYLFCGLFLLLQLRQAYEIYLWRIPLRRKLFNKFKSLCLGLETVYPRPIVEQLFNIEMPNELMNKFITIDEELPLGITKKYIIRCATECQITLSKEQKQFFYQKNGLLYGQYSKSSGINLKELQAFIKQYKIDYSKFITAMETTKTQEIQWQNRLKILHKNPEYISNDFDSINKRINPQYTILQIE